MGGGGRWWEVVGGGVGLWCSWHVHTYVMLQYCTLVCTSYIRYPVSGLRVLPNICHATLLWVLMRFHTDLTLRYCRHPCTSTHASSYATVLLYVSLHFQTYVMLRQCGCFASSTQQSCYATVSPLLNIFPPCAKHGC